MEETFGWCVVGCGHIAKKVINQLRDTRHKVVAAYNRNYQKAEAFTQEFGGTAYKTLEEAVKAKGVQCVYIATANESHGTLTKQCINLGVPVLCEKPFALNEREAKEVIDLAKQKKVYVAEAMWTWHDDVPLRIREVVKGGNIGKIKKAKLKFSFPMLKPGDTTSRLVNPALGGGCLLDIGIYPIRYAYELFGMPKALKAKATLFNGVDIDDKVTMIYDDFNVETQFSFAKLRGESLSLVGSDGRITNQLFHMSLNARVSGKNPEKILGHGMLYGYIEEFDHTAKDVLAGKLESNYIPHQATIDTMKLLDESRMQMGVVFPGD